MRERSDYTYAKFQDCGKMLDFFKIFQQSQFLPFEYIAITLQELILRSSCKQKYTLYPDPIPKGARTSIVDVGSLMLDCAIIEIRLQFSSPRSSSLTRCGQNSMFWPPTEWRSNFFKIRFSSTKPSQYQVGNQNVAEWHP